MIDCAVQRIGELGVLALVVALAACDRGDGDVHAIGGVDASRRDAFDELFDCDPRAPAGQQYCNVGSKCGWLILQEVPERVGVIRCVPDGPVALGGACAYGRPGETSGSDDCQLGGVCVAGQCEDVCGFGGGANDLCASGQSCTRHDGLWANGVEVPLYGVCEPTSAAP